MIKKIMMTMLFLHLSGCGGESDNSDTTNTPDLNSESSCTYELDLTSPNAPVSNKSVLTGTVCTSNSNTCLESLQSAAASAGYSLNGYQYSIDIKKVSSCQVQQASIVDIEVDPNSWSMQTGCYAASYKSVNSGDPLACGLISTFGDPVFDANFFAEVAIQQDFFGTYSPVYAFDECEGSYNALSFPNDFILFGKNLVNKVLKKTNNDIGVAAILAHEYAHQIQFDFGWIVDTEPTVRKTELEADFFSGYFLVVSRYQYTGQIIRGELIESYYNTLQEFGDFQFNSPTHHGTPHERSSAGLAGLETGIEAIRRNTLFSYPELHNAATSFIENQMLNKSNTSSNLLIPENRIEKLQLYIRGEIEAKEFNY
ncbi:hypothetical protein [Pseudoalteromonas sp. G4]|uniref:hypothetical protein n=1 Tax=Pseudoalteromonas sp. G4 TaxID=2992761 RepID=UPI00237D87DD|nr:hypothetical protein [Pseudoalteromonas sp. G4]MDE3272748.1 hypothetical protein [Pseudoalteromonas sp. G4]